MKNKLINVSFFRRKVVQNVEDSPFSSNSYLLDQPKRFSRRDFLKTMGLVPVVYGPIVDTVGKILGTGFEVRKGDNIVSFWTKGKEKWTIAANWFDGNPKVSFTKSSKVISIRLKNAYFPGTQLSADFKAKIENKGGSWKFWLSSPSLGRFKCDSFTGWLNGRQLLRGTIPQSSTILSTAAKIGLQLGQGLGIQLDPDWTLSVKGINQIRLKWNGELMMADKLELSLNSGNPQSPVCARDLVRDCLIYIENNNEGFGYQEYPKLAKEQALTVDGKSFDKIYIESGVDYKGIPVHTFIQQSTPGKSISFRPFVDAQAENGGPEFPLCKVHSVSSYRKRRSEKAVFASLENEEVYWQKNGAWFRFSKNGSELPDLEVKEAGGEHLTHFVPYLTEAFVPVKNGIGVPFKYPKPIKVVFNNHFDENLIDKSEHIQRFDKENGSLKTSNNDQVVLPFLRVEDMVVLLLQFVNYKLDLDKLTVTRVENKPGYLSAYFPPQHFGEQAFFETDPKLAVQPPDPDTGSSAEYPTHLPVNYRMANLSRLVFKVPNDHPGFDTEVDKMLDWSTFTLNVHPRGLSTAGMNKPYAYVPFQPEIYKLTPEATLQPIESATIESTKKPQISIARDKDKIKKKPQRGKLKLPERKPSRKPTRKPTDRTEVRPDIAVATDPKVITRIDEAPAIINKKEFRDKIAVQAIPDLFKIYPVLIDNFHTPRFLDTFLEIPYRLYISPTEKHKFEHDISKRELISENKSAEAKEFGVDYSQVPASTELYVLWNSKVRQEGVDGKGLSKIKFRALWSKDANQYYDDIPTTGNFPFRNSMDASDRHKLVHLTANYSALKEGQVALAGTLYKPQPFHINRLLLTSLGAILDFYGDWDGLAKKPPELNILSWIHRGRLGRDNYVRLVYSGYLYPFGNSVSLVKITERRIDSRNSNFGAVGLNFQRMYIQVKQQFISYKEFSDQGEGARMHFKNILIKDKRTPNIEDPTQTPSRIEPGAQDGAFWIYVGNKPFDFTVIAEDQEGREIEFQIPMIFVSEPIGVNSGMAAKLQNVQNTYRSANSYNKSDLEYQMMAISPMEAKKGDTAFETKLIRFGTFDDGGVSSESALPAKNIGKVLFHPVLREAEIDATSVNNLTGGKDTLTIIPYTASNTAKVFATLKPTAGTKPLSFEKGSDKSGGIITPSLNIGALSSTFGPVGGNVSDFVNSSSFLNNGSFDPSDFFQGALPKLFGAIDLFEIIQTIALAGGAAEKVPKLVQEIINEGTENEVVKVGYSWNPDLQSASIPPLSFNQQSGKTWNLQLDVEAKKPLNAEAPTVSIEGEISNFVIELSGIISVNFDKVYFKSYDGKKPDVGADMGDIIFLGPLKFLNTLQQLIPTDGFSDPPYVDIGPNGVDVGYTLSIPDVQSGVFALRNLKLSANLSLPLIGGEPLTFTFKFCEAHNPFVATVSAIGGGGYFGLTISMAGLQKVDVVIEFGASLSIDIGVASGGVYIMGGLQFTMETENGVSSIFFTGYIKMGGSLSVLGIISISVTFKMSLNYEATAGLPSKGQKEVVWGEATLKVKVEVLFFSKTVSMTAKRELKSTEADPLFTDLIDEPAWQEYATAFA